ncbi:MAG TPA: biotin transporter BioY [Tissierellaceae bacterium]
MKLTTKEIIITAMFTSLTSLGAYISIPLGEVPITLQTLFVLLSGLILGHKLGALSQLTYLILGLIGLPIFSTFSGGLQSVMKPSFGFIVGFVFSAYIVGKIAYIKKGSSTINIWLASSVGTIIIYLFGIPYMYYILNIVLDRGLSFSTVFKIGCLVFLPGDILKLIVASFVAQKILPIVKIVDK